MGNKGPILPDFETLIKAGFNPKTGKCRFPTPDKELKFNARRIFRIVDEQRAVNRYKWYNLPAGLSSQELERLLYLKYSLVFFYMKDLDQFFFMPYALDGTIDFYGRYNTVHPVPMTSGMEKEEDSKEYKNKLSVLSQMKLQIVKDVVVFEDEVTEDLLLNSGVILRDYTNQMGQMGEPRYTLNDRLLELEADCLCFVRTNLLVNSGIQGLRVADADSAAEVVNFTDQMYNSALNGSPYVAITSKVELQEIQPNSTTKASEYFLALQSIDNLILSTYGIENTGIYEKSAHILESENAVNMSNVSLVNQDGITQRQNFCNIVNSIWDLGIWCEIAEPVVGYDMNQDGVTYDESTGGAGSGYSAEAGSSEGGEE